jgi:hypothetical protein
MSRQIDTMLHCAWRDILDHLKTAWGFHRHKGEMRDPGISAVGADFLK